MADRNRKTTMAKQNQKTEANARTGNGKIQTFSFSCPHAMNVQLVGDFTDWQQNPMDMKQVAGGLWQTTVKLPPGEHHYRFLVDGHWQDDPECQLRAPNPYGSQDSVLQVA